MNPKSISLNAKIYIISILHVIFFTGLYKNHKNPYM